MKHMLWYWPIQFYLRYDTYTKNLRQLAIEIQSSKFFLDWWQNELASAAEKCI